MKNLRIRRIKRMKKIKMSPNDNHLAIVCGNLYSAPDHAKWRRERIEKYRKRNIEKIAVNRS